MNSWTKQAGDLQQSVRQSETNKIDSYTDEEVRQATVHAREDITMLVSLLESANSQLNAIRWSLGLLVLMAGVAMWLALKALRYI